MPELPEVETFARGLREPLVGRTFTGVSVYWARNIAYPTLEEFETQIVGRRVDTVGRRGKYVVITLDRGYLLVHLKMTGALRVLPAGEPVHPHVRVLFDLDDGRQLRFRDPRKFGRIYLVDAVAQVTGHLGPEPLTDDLTLDAFCALLQRRKGRLKSLLLNQEFTAGIGNIYANEALFAARLHPERRANTLTRQEQADLYHAIRQVLARAIDAGGTTLRDGGYTDAEGEAGRFQVDLAVHDRARQPCRVCGTPIERLVVGARSAYFCPHCQPE
ncbi:MAG TPA: bifunctional DNA-formamidopyrimidine glycosylase/DNA-(apurinic or apyrimidinic site) lyase [Anaerolineae bacterium]|jgi:formamidopyrimidine-DNA glycosylase|nr:bifunctional DNA-formamidopyrimidine glycosylase/DNA-(apurinic or apyrimidinic site) lyase [Anaerolineae bacterium]